MAVLEPSQALNACETALRELMAAEYRSSLGADWLTQVASEEQRSKWSERARLEGGRLLKGVAEIPVPGLEYSEFYELVNIAEAHWEPLAKALGKRKSVLPLLARFGELRNTVAHDRQLFPYEQDLFSGIAGLIRNQVTIHMSTADPAGEYYPRITAAWDSLGHRVKIESGASELAGGKTTEAVLRPGQAIQFTLVAVDPQGRDLAWECHFDGSQAQEVTSASGDEVRTTWTLTHAAVKEHSVAHFYMRTIGSEYHRVGSYDQRAYFSYIVRPPL